MNTPQDNLWLARNCVLTLLASIVMVTMSSAADHSVPLQQLSGKFERSVWTEITDSETFAFVGSGATSSELTIGIISSGPPVEFTVFSTPANLKSVAESLFALTSRRSHIRLHQNNPDLEKAQQLVAIFRSIIEAASSLDGTCSAGFILVGSTPGSELVGLTAWTSPSIHSISAWDEGRISCRCAIEHSAKAKLMSRLIRDWETLKRLGKQKEVVYAAFGGRRTVLCIKPSNDSLTAITLNDRGEMMKASCGPKKLLEKHRWMSELGLQPIYETPERFCDNLAFEKNSVYPAEQDFYQDPILFLEAAPKQ